MFHEITDDCIACDACPRECPVGAIEAGTKKYRILEDVCLDCGSCVGVCPTAAIVSKATSEEEITNAWAEFGDDAEAIG